ncbi:hypothetical protein D3C85_1394330 [compost metagenome]
MRAHREGAIHPVYANGVKAAAHQQEDGVVEHARQAQQGRSVEGPQAGLMVAGGGGQGKEGHAQLVALALRRLLHHAFLHQALQHPVHGGLRLAGAGGDIGQAQLFPFGVGQHAQYGERALQHPLTAGILRCF